MRECRRAAAFVSILLAAGTARGGRWTAIGPPGGTVAGVAFAASLPSRAYAAVVGGGIYRSDDSGATWTASGTGLANLRTFSVAVDRTDPDVAYAASFRGTDPDGGVFKTTDGGASWSAVRSGLAIEDTTVVRIDPAASQVLYVGTLSGGIFRSGDGAATWHDVGSGLAAGASVIAIEIDAASHVYASVALGGEGAAAVIKSTDGGATWSHADAGLPTSDRVAAIAAQPGSSTILLAATISSGIFRSADGGASWTSSSGGIAGGFRAASLSFDPADALVVYSGGDGGTIYRSSDAGIHWTVLRTGTSFQVVSALGVSAASPRAILAGTSDRGILRSGDGSVWTPGNIGMRGQTIATLGVDPSDPRRMYAAGVLGGVHRTIDGGAMWTAADGDLPQRIFLSGFDWGSEYVAALAVDPSSPDTVYAGVSQTGPGADPAGGGLFKSTDGGTTWHPAMTGITDGSFPVSIGHLAIDPSHPQRVFAAAEGHGLFRSTDGGASWVASPGIPFAFLNGVAIDPDSPSLVFAVTSQGLYRTADSGDHFALSDAGLAGSATVRAFAFDSSNPQRVFAGTFGGEISVSVDAGAHWAPLASSLAPHGVTGLAFVAPGTLYASTEDAGIFESADLGAHWTAADDGLRVRRVFTMTAVGTRLVAGLFGDGVAILDTVPPGRRQIIPAVPPTPALVER